MKRLATVALLVAAFAVGRPVIAGAAGKLAEPSLSFDSSGWSAKASPNFASHPPSINELTNFLNPLFECGGESDPSIGRNGNDERHDQYVCSFTFKDLRHNGMLSLIVGVGVTGVQICREVDIIDKTPQGFDVHRAGGDIGAGDQVSGSVKDLRGDGRLEIIRDDSFANYGNCDACCWATFPSIYAWTGHDYTNVSAEFSDFYRQRIDALKGQISEIKPFEYKGAWYFGGKRECLLGEVALLERFVGSSPNAGLDHATQLAKSKDQFDRDFGSQLLRAFKAPQFSGDSSAMAKDSLYREAVVKPDCLRTKARERRGKD